jgi:hypothetical protein
MAEVPVDELRALLAEPLDRFVAARNERVKALRADGRREDAALLATVRKPSRLAARVAALARVDVDAAAGAVQAAEDLEAAQEGDGDLREAMAALKPAIEAVLATGTTDDRLDLGVPLRTVLADADVRQAWLDGVLVELPGPGSSPSPAATGRHLTLVPTGPDATATSTPKARRSKRSAGGIASGVGVQRRAAEQRTADQRAGEQQAAEQRDAVRRARQAEVDEAEGAVGAARVDLDHATTLHREAEDRLAEVQRKLADAEAEVKAASVDVAEAEQRLAALQEMVDRVRAALHLA